ncbi:NifB/NifX family molybdenum-iron cluster-binding protein [Pontiellaceae bacterium B12227]|nr:NifB/NifX family molybdenum-iron cluster-binding protein [Pontiellaceae bacterium B12227]
MRIALTTTGNDLDAPLADRFGRASGFLVYDTDVGTFVVKGNDRNPHTSKGAGIQVALKLLAENVDMVICSHIGSIAYETLDAANIAVYECNGATVREAIHQLIYGKLMAATGANVEAHRVAP